jgi:hypothetical protein
MSGSVAEAKLWINVALVTNRNSSTLHLTLEYRINPIYLFSVPNKSAKCFTIPVSTLSRFPDDLSLIDELD